MALLDNLLLGKDTINIIINTIKLFELVY